MKNKSISFKIFVVFLGFTFSIFLFIELFTKLFLPNYYVNRKINTIDQYVSEVKITYEKGEIDKSMDTLEQLKYEVGGEVYYYDNSQVMGGNASGKGKYQQNSGNHFVPEGDIFESQYENKAGISMYVIGIKIDDNYFIYEGSIASLDSAVNTMMEFFIILLIISILVTIIGAYIISQYVTKPIKQLNELAKQMKNKEALNFNVSSNDDEIGQLNNSLNLLYEELLSNIQRLETELKKERDLEKLKKQFLAQATHELKTPLAVIQGYAELVQDEIYKDEDERNYYIKSIYDETESMNRLIMDILDYSKIESGFFTVNKEETFINPWINKLISTFKTIIENKGLSLTVHNHVGDLCVNIDGFRIEQVVKNLLSNAMEHGQKNIFLNAYNLNEQLVIEIINDGPPIDENDLPYIFDSFYKKKGKKEGTGLGLAIVKGIIELHEGNYRVENEENGVKFCFIIR